MANREIKHPDKKADTGAYSAAVLVHSSQGGSWRWTEADPVEAGRYAPTPLSSPGEIAPIC